MSGNVATGNTLDGMLITGNIVTNLTITRNASVGNQRNGVLIREFSPTTIFAMNNIFGNDAGGNCGLVNNSGTLVDATNNFWGAASGPGPDPADDACDAGAPNVTITVPFATKPFNVK